MPKWEYAVIPLIKGMKDIGVTTQEQLLDKYGLEGWKLVSVVTLTVQEGLEIVAYFKRERT